MTAIIAAGGRQYHVSQGDVIYVDKIDREAESVVTFPVLLLSGDGVFKVGNPVLEDAKVEGKIVGQVKSAKVLVYKYKSKKNYSRKAGHRQQYTKVEITSVSAS